MKHYWPTKSRKRTLFSPSKSPAALFAEFEQLLVSNSGEDAFDVAVKLLAAKMHDELLVEEKHVDPRFVITDSVKATHSTIEELLKGAAKRWPGIISFNGGLNLSPEQLVRCIGPLCGWHLAQEAFIHLDAVLERLVARSSKGSLGQYFTPRGVVRMMVKILNPRPKEHVLDPACGSSGFLFEAIRYSEHEFNSAPKCLGIDMSPRALRVSTLLAAAVGPNKLTLSCTNSIDGREFAKKTMNPDWDGFVEDEQTTAIIANKPWGVWHQLRCDVLLTNPPFAGELNDAGIIDVYESQKLTDAKRKGAVGREHLFLERAINLLRPGGRLAIVLPQGILANASAAYLRHWVTAKCRILGVIGLHPYTFLPYTGVKTSILFLSKLRTASFNPYPVFFAVSLKPGKDSSGRAMGESDYEAIAMEFQDFLASDGVRWARTNFARGNAQGLQCSIVQSDEVSRHDRLDAEYYEPGIRKLFVAMKTARELTIADVVFRTLSRFKRDKHQDIDYIDISSVDSKTGIAMPTRISSSEAPSRASYVVNPGDVLVSTVRPDRNTVALVGKSIEGLPQIASNGFCVLRPKTIAPEVLFAYCKSDVFRRLLARHATASMYPAVTDKDVLNMPLALPSERECKKITVSTKAAVQKLEQAEQELRRSLAKMNESLPHV